MGAALESVVCYLLDSLRGLKVIERDVRCKAEELDLVVFNGQTDELLRSWEPVIFVECKNWSKPVGAMEVSWFIDHLRQRKLGNGIFVARRGITGDFRRDAGSVVFGALREGIRVIVLTGEDLDEVQTIADFRALLTRRFCGLFVGRLLN